MCRPPAKQTSLHPPSPASLEREGEWREGRSSVKKRRTMASVGAGVIPPHPPPPQYPLPPSPSRSAAVTRPADYQRLERRRSRLSFFLPLSPPLSETRSPVESSIAGPSVRTPAGEGAGGKGWSWMQGVLALAETEGAPRRRCYFGAASPPPSFSLLPSFSVSYCSSPVLFAARPPLFSVRPRSRGSSLGARDRVRGFPPRRVPP